MQKHGEFDTDAAALERRMQAHERYGTGDLNAWIMECLEPAAGDDVLDLGCGTGKQSIPLAELVGSDGTITSVDLSPDALSTAKARAESAGVDTRLRLVQSDLDDVPTILSGAAFDRALASYSLYYAQGCPALLEFLFNAIRPGGTLFFCGPSTANNHELKVFHNALKNMDGPGPATSAAMFLEGEGPETVRRLFGACDVLTFENAIRFASAAALYEYWSSYNLYDPELADTFMVAADKHFQANDEFTTVKRVLGIRGKR
jgi:SAM-dependent methyltransferase